MRDKVLTDDSLSDKNKEITMKESTIGAYYIHNITEKLIISANKILNSLGLITERQNVEDIDDETYKEDIEENETFEVKEIKELKKLGIIGSSNEDM